MKYYSFIFLSTLMATPSFADTQMWVAVDNANRRSCPSIECGVVGRIFYRESAAVSEVKDGWGRITKYYNASCSNGRSDYITSGRAACSPENGIIDGKFAEWVKMDLLTEVRPPDPALSATGTAKLVAGSDDFLTNEAAFVKAADDLISSGECSEKDFQEYGGFFKSTNRGDNIYFMFCGSDKIYLDVVNGETSRE